jgi:probable phosphoglycerate mutase
MALYERAVAAVNRAVGHPGPVLVVAHGALFRALRLGFGHKPNVRTPNALPIHCVPPMAGETIWSVTPAELAT